MTEKLVIVGSLDPSFQEKGDTFYDQDWPPHVTMMPWFWLGREGSQSDLELSISNSMERYEPQDIVGGKEAMFGPKKDVPVRLLRRLGSLPAIHTTLLLNVASQDGRIILDSRPYVGDDYVPHVTLRDGKGLDKDEEAHIGQLLLVKGNVNGPRTVINTFPLLGKKRG